MQETMTYTSRTTSGSINVRSSCISSLQQTPSRLVLEHLADAGVGTPGAAASMGHTGGFLCFTAVSGRGGRGTTVAVEEVCESSEWPEVDMVMEGERVR